MKKIILSLIFIITLNSCKSTFYDENIEIRIYRYHLGVVENFYKTGYLDNDDSFLRSITFLENLTKIKCNFEEQYVMVHNPSKKVYMIGKIG